MTRTCCPHSNQVTIYYSFQYNEDKKGENNKTIVTDFRHLAIRSNLHYAQKKKK